MISYRSQYSGIDKKVNKWIASARNDYSNLIDKEFSNYSELPFGFEIKKQNIFDKCHMHEVYRLKRKILSCAINKSSQPIIDRCLDEIRDINNFLPLEPGHHRIFDRNWFTYTEDGAIYALNSYGEEYIEQYVNEKYHQIPSYFLNEKRVEYIKKRNSYLNWEYSS